MSPKNKVSTNYQKYVDDQLFTNYAGFVSLGTISPVIEEILVSEYATEQWAWFNSVIDEEYAL